MDNTKVCVNCGKTIDKKAKVCPYCNKKQPGSKAPVIIIVSALIILLAVFAVYVKGLLDDMGMKMMNPEDFKGAAVTTAAMLYK